MFAICRVVVGTTGLPFTSRKRSFAVCLLSTVLPTALGGCGVFTPDKYPFIEDTVYPDDGNSKYGILEQAIVGHVQCEISKGIWEVWKSNLKHKKWFYTTDWGVSATITLTFEDQSALNPGISITEPFSNRIFTFPTGGPVTASQSFSFGVGGTGTGSATRTETIQFTYSNKALLLWAQRQLLSDPATCEESNTGIMINSDLRIDQFIYDKMSIASSGNDKDPIHPEYPPFNTFQYQITFVATLGASATPTWKFARVTGNTTTPLVSATRTNTNGVTITFGEIQPSTPTTPAQLKSSGQILHNSGVAANQIGTQNKATSGN